ncbi:uncharacterized protein LOC106558410 [Canis lupus familiaris]|uniref:uncharacterized protein LOC106558410 n=1 Tax=Canis lupus familiaris TaxID=9615 RepID=UPI0018F2B158|nr:uncharacterized protein LOC106558410 [Canis lupus familiaris]XP_038385584.1 uncharacterized protein LOC106558410 [Canis lupus familiaris]XP_038513898.1 uncharacterized protein LOC106558410 [Canis lupus familiaris]
MDTELRFYPRKGAPHSRMENVAGDRDRPSETWSAPPLWCLFKRLRTCRAKYPRLPRSLCGVCALTKRAAASEWPARQGREDGLGSVACEELNLTNNNRESGRACMHTPEQGLGKARGAGERAQAGSLSSKEPDSGLNPMTLRSRPEPKSRVGHNCPSSPASKFGSKKLGLLQGVLPELPWIIPLVLRPGRTGAVLWMGLQDGAGTALCLRSPWLRRQLWEKAVSLLQVK